MTATELETLHELYEQDETAWLERMAELVGQRRLDELDYNHLREYLADTAQRDRREVKSRLTILLAHLLKWEYQPDRRSGGWGATILAQQQELADLIASGVLRTQAVAVLTDAYTQAVRQAAIETGLASATFPRECPYTVDALLRLDRLPG